MRLLLVLLATRALFTGAFDDVPPTAPPLPTAAEVLAAPAGGWTWFNSPNAIHVDGKTHFAYISGEGHPYAAYIEDGVVSTPVRLYPSQLFEVDDHDDPALVQRSSDGFILAYFSTHFGDDQYVTVWDGDSWGDLANIGAAIGAGTTTYMNPVELENGTIRVFFRDHYDGVNVEWAYADSADGEAFSGHVSFVRESGVITYVKPFAGADGRIDFVASGHPAFDTGGSIWHFYYEDGSYYKSDGSSAGSLPLDTSDMTKVYDGATTKAWLWDIARVDGELAIVFATLPGNDGSEHRYQYARWTGSAWNANEVADGGGTVAADPDFDADQVFYSGGIAIDRLDVNIVYYSSDAGGSFDILRATTGNDGETWTARALTSDATNDMRPKAVQTPDSSLRVMWMRGPYNEYVDWNTGTWAGTLEDISSPDAPEPPAPETPAFLSRPASGVLVYDGVSSVLIENKAINPGSFSSPSGIAISILNVDGTIVIRDVDIANAVGGIYIYNCTGTVLIEGLRSRNIGNGTIGSGQSNHIQFAECVLSGSVRDSKFLGGRTEDMLSIWHSGGVGVGEELIFEDNQVQGLVSNTGTARAWDSASGTGIIICDGGGSGNNGYVIVRNNTFLTPGQVGIQVIDGPGLQIYGNTIYGQQRPQSNNPLTSWEGNPVGVVHDNDYYWFSPTGSLVSPWLHQSPSGLTMTNNTQDASIDPDDLAVVL